MTFSRPLRFIEVSLSADVSTVPQRARRAVPRREKKSRKTPLWTPGEGVPVPQAKISEQKNFDITPPEIENEAKPDFAPVDEKQRPAIPESKRFMPDFKTDKGNNFQISGPVSNRTAIRRIYPEYPRAAQLSGAAGEVVIKFWVTPSGSIEKTQVEQTSGVESLDASALDAVKKWLFMPLSPGEQQITQWGRITIKFELK